MATKLTFRTTDPKPVRARWPPGPTSTRRPAVTAADLATVFEMGRRSGVRG